MRLFRARERQRETPDGATSWQPLIERSHDDASGENAVRPFIIPSIIPLSSKSARIGCGASREYQAEKGKYPVDSAILR